MADTVVILTNRPSKVKNIYDIKLTNKKSPITNRDCKEFNTYYKKIWQNIDHHV